jgi:hypothetical protein
MVGRLLKRGKGRETGDSPMGEEGAKRRGEEERRRRGEASRGEDRKEGEESSDRQSRVESAFLRWNRRAPLAFCPWLAL